MTSSKETRHSVVTIDAEGVATLEICNAGVLNLLNSWVLADVAAEVSGLAARSNIRALILRGAATCGNGVLDAACAAKILGIGVDVDQFNSYPDARPCLLTSAEKHLQLAVSSALQAIAGGSAAPGDSLYDAKNDGIGVSVGHNLSGHWAPDAQTLINAAIAGMKDGSLKTCPDKCGSLQ